MYRSLTVTSSALASAGWVDSPAIVGIDLGTINSLVAHVDGGIPKVIPDAEGRALLPSIVAFTPAGVVVGEARGVS